MNDKELDSRISAMIEEVMELDMSKIDRTQKINTISEWNSFNNLMLISKLQDDFDISFTTSDIEDTVTVNQIYELVKKKLSAK